MDLDDFRSILKESGVDVWTFIDTAISVASLDYRNELKDRRDEIVERLYASVVPRCRNCDLDAVRVNGKEIKKEKHQRAEVSVEKESSSHEERGDSPSTPQSLDRDDDRDQSYGRSIDEEQTKILTIKEHLEDPDQVCF